VSVLAAALLAATPLAGCGPRGGDAAPRTGAVSSDSLATEARRHLDESERLLRAADAKRSDGDARLSDPSAAGARETFVEAGRLYEAASLERNKAYAAAAEVREAWAAEARARCRARQRPSAESEEPLR
jgi:hypothetical protein